MIVAWKFWAAVGRMSKVASVYVSNCWDSLRPVPSQAFRIIKTRGVQKGVKVSTCKNLCFPLHRTSHSLYLIFPNSKIYHPWAMIWQRRCGYKHQTLFEGFLTPGHLIPLWTHRLLDNSGKLKLLSTFCVKQAVLYQILNGYCLWKLNFPQIFWSGNEKWQKRSPSKQAFQTKENIEAMQAFYENGAVIHFYWKNKMMIQKNRKNFLKYSMYFSIF